MYPILFTAEQTAELIAVAHERAMADGVVTDEELSRELVLAAQELTIAEMRKRRLALLAAPPIFMAPTGVAGGDAARVDAWQQGEKTLQRTQCQEKLVQNKAFISGAAAVLTSAGVALVSGGATLPAVGKGLIPLAGVAISYLLGQDSPAPSIPIPDWGAYAAPVVASGGGGAAEYALPRVTVQGAASGKWPAAGGHGDRAGETPAPPSEHHVNPHHEPLKPGHHDTTGDHKPGSAHHPV